AILRLAERPGGGLGPVLEQARDHLRGEGDERVVGGLVELHGWSPSFLVVVRPLRVGLGLPISAGRRPRGGRAGRGRPGRAAPPRPRRGRRGGTAPIPGGSSPARRPVRGGS